MSFIEKLLELYPLGSREWNMKQLSGNKRLPLEFIAQHIDAPWHWKKLSGNHNVTLAFTKLYPDKPWRIRKISANVSTTMEVIRSHFHELDIKGLSKNPNLAWDFVCEQLDSPHNASNEWDWYWLHTRLLLTLDVFSRHPEIPWDWGFISEHFILPDEAIYQHWSEVNWFYISRHATWDRLLSHIDWPWYWLALSYGVNIHVEAILDNPRLPWVWNTVLLNRTMTEEVIKAHPELKQRCSRYYHYFSRNNNIGEKFVEEYLFPAASEQDICWDDLSGNKNLSPAFIIKHRAHPWNMHRLINRGDFTLPQLLRVRPREELPWPEVSRYMIVPPDLVDWNTVALNETMIPWQYGKGFPMLPRKYQTQMIMIAWVCREFSIPSEIADIICEASLPSG